MESFSASFARSAMVCDTVCCAWLCACRPAGCDEPVVAVADPVTFSPARKELAPPTIESTIAEPNRSKLWLSTSPCKPERPSESVP